MKASGGTTASANRPLYWFATWIAAARVDPALVVPGATDLIDKTAYEAMRAFRKPFVLVHEFAFYALATVVTHHIVAVVVTEAASPRPCSPGAKFSHRVHPTSPINS